MYFSGQLLKDTQQFGTRPLTDEELLRQQEEFISKNLLHVEKRRHESPPPRLRSRSRSPRSRSRSYSPPRKRRSREKDWRPYNNKRNWRRNNDDWNKRRRFEDKEKDENVRFVSERLSFIMYLMLNVYSRTTTTKRESTGGK